MLKREVGRLQYANFHYQAASRITPCHVTARVVWHPAEFCTLVDFIVPKLSRPAAGKVAFDSMRGACKQWIKEGECTIK